jgi:hypothetical protein
MHLIKLSSSLLFVFSIFLAGCAMHFPKTDETMKSPQASFDVPPKQLLATVKQVVTSPPLNLTITEEQNGSILTSGQPFPGDWHVARRWQEQTLYRVHVIPDFDHPDRSSLTVRDFTQQRATDGMKWENSAEIQRPERSQQLIERITQAVNSSRAATTAATSPPR